MIDYFCPSCDSPFQLKSQSKPVGSKIVDAAYSEMKRAILEDRTPNLFVLHYDLDTWAVRTVLLVPHFAFTLSTVEKRPPLAPTARRAGWVGCNILLDKIPLHARISIVSEGTPRTSTEVRNSYNRLRPLEKLQVEKRGWTLDVLQIVQSLGKMEFTLADVTRTPTTWPSFTPKTPTCETKSASNSRFCVTSAYSNSSAPAPIGYAERAATP